MRLDPVLLEILVCPDCKGSLTVDNEHEELICNRCGLIYPVRDDIPVMLIDEARRPEPEPEPEPEPSPATAVDSPADADGSVESGAPDPGHPLPEASVTESGPATGRDA